MQSRHIEIVGRFPSYHPIPDGKGSWVSADPLTISSDRIGSFTVPAGSHNNLASIPRIFHTLFPVNGPHRIAAIIHDYLYEAKPVRRDEADGVFFDAMAMSKNHFYNSLPAATQRAMIKYGFEGSFLTNGPLVCSTTAHIMWSAVRAGGWAAWG